MALGPFAAQNHWDVRNTELARGFEAQMAVDHIAVTSNQTRNIETKFSDTTAHEVHGCIVLAPVAQYRTNLSMGQICIFIGSSLPDCEEREFLVRLVKRYRGARYHSIITAIARVRCSSLPIA